MFNHARGDGTVIPCVFCSCRNPTCRPSYRGTTPTASQTSIGTDRAGSPFKDHRFPGGEIRFGTPVEQSPGPSRDTVSPAPFNSDIDRIRKEVADDRRGRGRKVAVEKLSQSPYSISAEYPAKANVPAVPSIYYKQTFYIFFDCDGEIQPFSNGDPASVAHSFVILFRRNVLIDSTSNWLYSQLVRLPVWGRQSSWVIREGFETKNGIDITYSISMGIFKKQSPSPSEIHVPVFDTTEDILADALQSYNDKGVYYCIIVPVTLASKPKPLRRPFGYQTVVPAPPSEKLALTHPKAASPEKPVRAASVEIPSSSDVVQTSGNSSKQSIVIVRSPSPSLSTEQNRENTVRDVAQQIADFYGDDIPDHIKEILEASKALPVKKRKRERRNKTTEEVPEEKGILVNLAEEEADGSQVRRSGRSRKPINLDGF